MSQCKDRALATSPVQQHLRPAGQPLPLQIGLILLYLQWPLQLVMWGFYLRCFPTIRHDPSVSRAISFNFLVVHCMVGLFSMRYLFCWGCAKLFAFRPVHDHLWDSWMAEVPHPCSLCNQHNPLTPSGICSVMGGGDISFKHPVQHWQSRC